MSEERRLFASAFRQASPQRSLNNQQNRSPVYIIDASGKIGLDSININIKLHSVTKLDTRKVPLFVSLKIGRFKPIECVLWNFLVWAFKAFI